MKKVLSKLSFAHLVGVGGKVRAESDDDEKDPAERDHEDGNVKKSEKEEKDEKAKKAEKEDDDKEKMEDDDDDASAEVEESDDEDGDDKEKSKKANGAKAEEGDDKDKDDDEIEMRGNSTAAKARRREQARCAAIFASPAAAKNPALAANLAFKTRVPRSEAIAVLEGSPSAVTPGANRAAKNPAVGPGFTPAQNSQQAITSGWDTAFAKATGKIR